MLEILLAFLLTAFASGNAALLSATVCPLPAYCSQANSSAIASGLSGYKLAQPNVKAKFIPLGSVELCNIGSFCLTHPPGSYCYTPTANLLKGECSCLPISYIECPFGVVNGCRDGFICVSGVNQSQVTTAKCARVSTSTHISVSTRYAYSTVIHLPTTTSTTFFNKQTVQMANLFSEGSTSTVVTVISVHPVSANYATTKYSSTSTSKLIMTSLPYTMNPIRRVSIVTSMCNHTVVGRPTTLPIVVTGMQLVVNSMLCDGPFPNVYNNYTKTAKVIQLCTTKAITTIRSPLWRQ